MIWNKIFSAQHFYWYNNSNIFIHYIFLLSVNNHGQCVRYFLTDDDDKEQSEKVRNLQGLFCNKKYTGTKVKNKQTYLDELTI